MRPCSSRNVLILDSSEPSMSLITSSWREGANSLVEAEPFILFGFLLEVDPGLFIKEACCIVDGCSVIEVDLRAWVRESRAAHFDTVWKALEFISE